MNPFLAVTMQDAADATGNGNELPLIAQYGTFDEVAFQVSGTFVGTVTFEGTVDGTNWVAVEVQSATDVSVTATTATAAGIHFLTPAIYASVRARVSAYTSGEITVVGLAK